MITKKKAIVITIVYSLIIALIGGLVGFLATYFPMKKSNNAYVSAQQEYILNNDIPFYTGDFTFNVDITLVSCVQNGVTYTLTNNNIHVVRLFSSSFVTFNFLSGIGLGGIIYVNTAADFVGGTHKVNVNTAFDNLSAGVITDLHFVVTGGADINNSDFLNWLSINTNPAIVQLATPTITGFSMNSHAIYFSTVPNASSYLLRTGNQTFSATGSGFILTVPGVYNVQAVGDGVNFSNSNWSNSYNCFSSLGAVTNLHFDSSSNSLVWSAVSNANGYKIYKDGVFLGSTSFTNFTVNSLGFYEVQATNSSNIFFIDGSRSTYNLTGSQLATPTIIRDNVVLTWNIVENATSYNIYCDNSLIDTVNVNHYALSNTGVYKICAVSSNFLYSNSDFSNTITVDSIQLATPILGINSTEHYIWWLSVPYATSYEIYLNDNYFTSTTDLSYYYSQFGDYKIKAVDDTGSISSSDFSNWVRVSATTLNTPFVLFSSDDVIFWTAIPNANYYEIYLNDVFFDTVPQPIGNSYTEDLQVFYKLVSAGSWTVVAVSNNWQYSDSEPSEPIVIIPQALKTPTVQVFNGLLVWDVIPYATSYDIYYTANSDNVPVKIGSSVGTSFVMVNDGYYYIIAQSKNIYYSASSHSNIIVFHPVFEPYSFSNLIGSVVDVPLSIFVGLFNFDLFGVNLITFFSTMISLCVVIIIIKFVLVKK